MRRRNILICAALKTYLLCFPSLSAIVVPLGVAATTSMDQKMLLMDLTECSKVTRWWEMSQDVMVNLKWFRRYFKWSMWVQKPKGQTYLLGSSGSKPARKIMPEMTDESLKALEFWLFQYRFCAPKAATAKHAFYVKQGPHEALMTWYDRLYDAAVYAFSYHQEGSPLKQLFMEDIQHQKPTSKLLLSLSRKSCSTSFWPKHKTKRKEQTVQGQVHGWLEESDLCPLPPNPQWIRPYGNTLNLNWTGYCHPIKV